MSVLNAVNSDVYGAIIHSGFKVAHYKATLAGDLTVGENFPPILILDPGGAARTVTLPAAADAENQLFCIINIADAAEDLTISDGAATVCTVAGSAAGATNDRAWVYCDGSSWYSLGVAADN